MKKFLKMMKSNSKFRITILISIMTLLIILLALWGTIIILDYKELQKTHEENNREHTILLKDYENVQKENKKYSAEIEELKQTEKQNEINNKTKELEETKNTLEKEKQSLESQITSLKEEVIKVKGEAKTYPAGYLTAGEDLPTGKYKIYGGSSNFVVYSSSGSLKVNIILGGRYGVDEYIYTFKFGDEVRAESSFKLVAVE